MIHTQIAQKIFSALMLGGIVLMLACCGPSVDYARANFSRISANRPVGSACYENDEASNKRALFHPRGPTGGWMYTQEAKVDYGRTRSEGPNELVQRDDGWISGYVKFDRPGYLRARSYDDYFGDVYCGWCPTRLAVKPTSNYVFVSLGTCAVGDGGLDQVYEVAWFPEGQSKGELVYSSAFPNGNSKLTAADIYTKHNLGDEHQFNGRLALDLIVAFVQKGDLKSANDVMEYSKNLLSKQKPAVDSKTGTALPPNESQRSQLLMLQTFDLGMSVGEPEFAPRLKELDIMLKEDLSSDASKTFAPMLPLFSWVGDCVAHNKPLPFPALVKQTNLYLHDPAEIGNYFGQQLNSRGEERAAHSIREFWIGFKNYIHGRNGNARANFEKYIKRPHTISDMFELAVAAKLSAKLRPAQRDSGSEHSR